jgi:hypothetical protein
VENRTPYPGPAKNRCKKKRKKGVDVLAADRPVEPISLIPPSDDHLTTSSSPTTFWEEMRGERGTVEALTAWRTEHPIQGQQRIDARRKPHYILLPYYFLVFPTVCSSFSLLSFLLASILCWPWIGCSVLHAVSASTVPLSPLISS